MPEQRPPLHPPGMQPLHAPQFDEAAAQYAQDYIPTSAVEMNQGRTGQTAQHVPVSPASHYQDPSPQIQSFPQTEPTVGRIQQLRRGGGLRTPGGLDGITQFAQVWFVWSLGFSVAYLGQHAAPPGVAKLMILATEARIISSMFGCAFLIGARHRLVGWSRDFLAAIAEVGKELQQLGWLLAAITAYICVRFVLG